MRTRLRKILRDIWSRKARTLLVSLSIFIGVFGTVTLFTMSELVVNQLEEDLDQDALAMMRIYLATTPGTDPDNAQVLEALRALPGVTAAEGQAVYPLYWKLPGDETFKSSFVFGYSDPYERLQLEGPRLESGAFPQPGANELVVERRFAEKYDLAVGDQIVVRTLSRVEGTNGGAASGGAAGSGADGAIAEETWTVSGTVFHPYGYQTFTTVLPEDSLFTTYADAQHLAAFRGFSSIYVRYDTFEQADANVETIKATIAQSGMYIPVFTFSEDPAENAFIRFAKTSANVLNSLALVALFVSGFLVFNVLNAIVTEQREQIGVMKSLGATRVDNVLIYTGMALFYGVIGVLLGVVLGIPAGYVAAQGFAESSNTQITEFGYSPSAIALGIAVGLAVPVLASLLPVWNGTRVRIIDAITNLGIASGYGHGPLARLVNRLPVPITIRQGISNVLRKKGRILLTVITLTLAAGAFMGIFAVFASVNEVLNTFFDTYNFHFTIEPNNTDNIPAVYDILDEQYSDLTTLGAYASLAIDIEGFDKELDPATGPGALFASGYDPAQHAYEVELVEGESLESNPAGVVLARPTAEHLDKWTGDTITISAGGQSDEFEIVGVAEMPYDTAWFDWRELARLGGFVDANGDPVPTGIVVQMPVENPSADEVDDLTEQINEVLLAHGITANYTNIELFIETLSNAVATFRTLFNFTALLIALVGAVGLFSTLSMSVYERQKEIGVMRSIGAGSSAIITQFLTEGVVVGVLAWVIGLPLSMLLNEILIAALNLGSEYNLGYPPIAAILGLVGMLAITTLASLWPSISAGRKTVSDILRYQ